MAVSLPLPLLNAFIFLFVCHVVEAKSDSFQLDTCGRPFSLDSSFSVLRWPFSSGNWLVRNNWKGGNEPGGEGSGWGQGRHFGSHYYAVDWNKVGSNDCDSIFYAPIGGTVIYSHWTCSPGCVATGENCRGNEVVIQSNVDTNYAFSVLHLNMVFVPVGRIVKTGDPLGTIGSTGFSSSAHAHCVLFKKINRHLTGITIGLQFPDEHAAPFDFSADCGGDGPHNIYFDVITGMDDLPSGSFEKNFRITQIGNSISIIAVNEPLKKFSIELYNNVGQKFLETTFIGIGTFNLRSQMRGLYILRITSGSKRITKKILY